MLKRMMALTLSLIMLFNISGEAFANLGKVSTGIEDEIEKLKEELSQKHEIQEIKTSTRSNKSLYEKMREAKERYIVALVKYNYAAQLSYAYKYLNSSYDKVEGELVEEYKNLEQDKNAIKEEYSQKEEEFNKYDTKRPGYNSWQRNRERLLREKEEKKVAIRELEKEIGEGKAGLEKLKGRKAKKASEKIQAKEEQLTVLKNNLAKIDPKIAEKDAKWSWYKETGKEIEAYNQKVGEYLEREEVYNKKVDNYDKEGLVKHEKDTYNETLENLYGGEAVPEEMKAHLEYDREALIDRYNELTWGKIKEVEREYYIAAARYENASKAYYDDLMYRYNNYEREKSKSQCEMAKRFLENRQKGLADIDEWGWKAIKWLSQDQLKNSTPSGIKEALTATWNTCGTGIAIQNAEDLDSMSWDGYEKNMNPDEYVDIKFYEYYEEYVKESEKHYEAVVRDNPKDITKVTIFSAYDFERDEQWEKLEGKRRGRELFMLMLANHELGYSMYRASVVKGGMGQVYSEYIEKQENQEKAEELEESEYVNLRGYNKVPRLEYKRYLVYDKPTDATKKRIFLRAKRMEEYSRYEVHRLMGKVVKGMYLDGKSMGEILGSEGISKKDINATFNKYAALMDKQTFEKQKANLANDLQARDYSNLVNWEVEDKFRPTKFDKVMNGIFCWLPSNWLPIAKDDISGDWMSLNEAYETDKKRAEGARLNRYAQIHKNHHFKEFVYVLSETPYNWNRHLLPIVRRINEEKQDIETATMLAELATGLKDNLEIKELALVAQRNTEYQVTEDPFYMVASFVFDCVALWGISKVIQVLSKVVVATVETIKNIRAGASEIRAVKNVAKIKKPSKLPKSEISRPARSELKKNPRNESLSKIKNKIKADKQRGARQSREARSEEEAAKQRKTSEQEHEKGLEREAQEISDYMDAKAEGKLPENTPMTLSQRIKRAWTNARVAMSIWWNIFKTPTYSLSMVSALGGEVAPTTVVIEQVANAEKVAGELTYVAGEVAKEGQVAGKVVSVASETGVVGEAVRATSTAGEVGKVAEQNTFNMRNFFTEFLDVYRATHIHRGLEVVSAIPSFKFGYQGMSGALASMSSSGVGSVPTVEAAKAAKVEDLANIAQKTYPELSKEQIGEYIKAGEVMFQAGQKPVMGITHPITMKSYELSMEFARRRREAAAAAQRQASRSAQNQKNANTLWWIYGDNVEKILSSSKRELEIKPFQVVAMIIIPMPLLKVSYTSGLTGKEIKEVRETIIKVFNEAGEEYASKVENGQAKINDFTVIEDENFTNILRAKIEESISNIEIKDANAKAALSARINKLIEDMKDGEIAEVEESGTDVLKSQAMSVNNQTQQSSSLNSSVQYMEDTLINEIDNILKAIKTPRALEGNETIQITDKIRQYIFKIISDKVFEFNSKDLTERQKNAINEIAKETEKFVNETKSCQAIDLINKVKNFYANLEWIAGDRPILDIHSEKDGLRYFGWISPKGISIRGDSFTENDFYKKLGDHVWNLARNHKKITVVINMHGGLDGSIQINDQLNTDIPTLLRRIKENVGSAKVNIITVSCHGQALRDFTEEIKMYGFNYLGISSVNNAAFIRGASSTDRAYVNYEMPQAFLNSIALDYLGSVLVYDGKTYRAIDFAKEYYKDDPKVLLQIELLEEMFFGNYPVDAMIELGKQEGYSLRLLNSEDELKTLANAQNSLSPEDIQKLFEGKKYPYTTLSNGVNIFYDFKSLENEAGVNGYPYIIKFEDGKILALDGPTTIIKYNVLKAAQELLKINNIPFDMSVIKDLRWKSHIKNGMALYNISFDKYDMSLFYYSEEDFIKDIDNILKKPISIKNGFKGVKMTRTVRTHLLNTISNKIAEVRSNTKLTKEQEAALDDILKETEEFINNERFPLAKKIFERMKKFYANVEWIASDNPVLNINGLNEKIGFFGGISSSGINIDDASYTEEDFYDKLALHVRKLAQYHKEFTIVVQMHGSRYGKILIANDKETDIPTLLKIIKENAGDSKVNIVTLSCQGQSVKDFTEQVLKYGYNYLGVASVNNSVNTSTSAYVNGDIQQAFLNIISQGYLGAVLVYEGKVYRAMDIAREHYKDNTNILTQIDLLQALFFGKDPVKTILKLGEQEGYVLRLLNSEDDLKTLSNINSDLTPKEIKRKINHNSFIYGITHFHENIASFFKKGKFKFGNFYYFSNQISDTGHSYIIKFRDGKILTLDGPTTIIKYNVLKAVQNAFEKDGISFSNSAKEIKEIKKNSFKPEGSASNQILLENIEQVQNPWFLQTLPTENLSEFDKPTIEALNNMIEKLNDYTQTHALTPKREAFFMHLKNLIYDMAKDPSNLKISLLETLLETINIFTAEKPIFVFYGENNSIVRPNHISQDNYFSIDLSKEKDFKASFEHRIGVLSSIFDEYTIVIEIHGGRNASLAVTKDKHTRITDLLDMVEKNRKGSTVNFISSACHSGSVLKRGNLNRPGINLLLGSGANDVCYNLDSQYLRVNDLPSIYFDLVKNRRYGAVMFYNGKFYNSTDTAYYQKEMEEYKKEIVLLNHIFLDLDNLGGNVFTLLKDFSSRWQNASFPLDKLNQLEYVPYPFNAAHLYARLRPPLDSNDSWKYKIERENKNKQIKIEWQTEIKETDPELHNKIVEMTERELKQNIPNWHYKDVVSSMAVPSITTNSFTVEQGLEIDANLSVLSDQKNASSQILEDLFNQALQRALEQSDKIGISAESIKRHFENKKERIKNTLEIIGLKAFVHSYQGKMAEINDLIEYANFIKDNFSSEAYELLLQKINPEQSQKYQELTEQMNDLRAKAAKDPTFREERDRVTSLQRRTAKGEGLFVQDILDKFKVIGSMAQKNLAFAEDLVNYILPKTLENEKTWQEKYLSEMFRQVGVNMSPDLLTRLGLDKNNDMSAFLKARKSTQKSLKDIFDLINSNSDKTIATVMNNLPWNKKTEKIFTQLGVDYESWTSPEKAGYIKAEIKIDVDKEKGKFVTDAKAISLLLLKHYPFLSLESAKKGITVKNNIIYLDDEEVNSFNQAAKTISILKKLILSASHKEVPTSIISEFIERLPRTAEFLETLTKNNQEITVRLADTNDISAVISMGANSACCRALGSLHEEAIPSLITNKMATAFEILAEGKVIGSIMVYLASVDGDLALVLGTLETRAVFAENENISRTVMNYARKFAFAIGKPHIPIYMAVTGQDRTVLPFMAQNELPSASAQYFNTKDKGYKIRPLGVVGNDPMYLSYTLTSRNKGDNNFQNAHLYHVSYPFEQRETIAPNNWESKLNPLNFIIKTPDQIISSALNSLKYSENTWTEEMADKYFAKLGMDEIQREYIIKNCYVRAEFDPNLFELFVQGFEVKKDLSFTRIAFNAAFDDEYGFDYTLYSRAFNMAKKLPLMPNSKILEYIVASTEKYNALLNITEKYPSLDAFKVIDAVSYEGDFDSRRYEKMLSLLSKGISFEAAKTLIKASCINDGEIFDIGKFNLISEIADEAVKRRYIFLPAENDKLSDIDIKDYIYLGSVEIGNALEIADKGTIVAAMGYKMNKFDDFLEAAHNLNLNLKGETREEFLRVFYPSSSKLAQQLEKEIKELKDQFFLTSKTDLPALKKQINDKTSQLRKLLEQGKLLSPQDKIDIIIIISNFSEDEKLRSLILSAKESIQPANSIIDGEDTANYQEKDNIWYKKVLELISEYLGKAYNEKIEGVVHLSKNPYLAQLFKSIQSNKFRTNFQELIALFHKDFETALDGLHHNVATKEKFEKYGLDYEKWTKPDTSLTRNFYDGNNYVEIKQTNMRDIGHSLFLGNYAYACTAIGGCHDKYAIPYIMNTLSGAIEIFVNGKPVGNSMIMPIIRQIPVMKDGEIVIGVYEKELAILIDDLKIASPYTTQRYLQEVAAFAQDLAKRIGIKSGKVYIGDSNTMGYNKLKFSEPVRFTIIGSVLDPIWLNAVCKGVSCGNQEYNHILVPAEKIMNIEQSKDEEEDY